MAAAMPNCGSCGLHAAQHACSRCRAVRYCGAACQRKHWPVHKEGCKAACTGAAALKLSASATAILAAPVGSSTQAFPSVDVIHVTPADEDFNLGVAYLNGFGGYPKIPRRAVQCYQRAVASGHLGAMYELAFCFEEGTGIAVDAARAIELFRRAAEAGHLKSQFYLGLCYRDGRGVPTDMVQAVFWYRRAAEGGSIFGQCNLGYCLEKGSGVAEDAAAAVMWYTRAAEAGDADAQWNLANCFHAGRGVATSLRDAVSWWKRAAAGGHEGAQNTLAGLPARLLRLSAT